MISERIKKAQSILKERSLLAILITSPSNIDYLTGFKSLDGREAFLLLTQTEVFIFTDPRNSETVRQIPDVRLIENNPKNPFLKNLKSLLKDLRIRRIGFEPENLTYAEYLVISKAASLTQARELVEEVRQIKEGLEIEKIKRACEIGDEAFQFFLSSLKEGVSEKEICKKIEKFIIDKDANISFSPIVAFGINSAIPHHQSGIYQLEKNNPVLLDFGVKYEDYCSDMSRTVYFGKVDNKFSNMYSTVLRAQVAAIEKVKKGVTARTIDKEARNFITTQGFEEIPHSTGHGIGLEVHELPHISPNSDEKLKTNMIFSVEPGIYIQGFGGVRIEDLVLLDDEGGKLLTGSNRSLIEI